MTPFSRRRARCWTPAARPILLRGACALLASALAGSTAGQEPAPSPFPTGKVIDSVVCRADASQSYALYLPSRYDATRRWPILYAFAANANGSGPVRLFSEAAEQYGYIVVGSNNSRNGPIAPVIAAADAMLLDTETRFAIDPQRVYATGSSGATTPALLVGVARGAGVIASAGALEGRTFRYPAEKVKGLAWFGTAGIADFNYPFMESFGQFLQGLGAVTHFATFDGGHSWFPKEVAQQAIEWMEIQAIKAGRRERDKALIDALFEKGQARARDLEAAGRIDEAATEYAALARDFMDLEPGLAELAAKGRTLADSKEAKAARRQLKEAARRQDEETAWFNANAHEQWSGRIKSLKKEAAKKPAGDWIAAQRVLDYLFVISYMNGDQAIGKGDYAAAAAEFRSCVDLAPKPWAYAALSRVLALQKDKRKALEALQNAVSAGYRDRAALEREKAFDILRDDPEYQRLVAGM